MGGGSFKLVSDCGLGVYEMVIQGAQKSRFVVVVVVVAFLRLLFQLVSTVNPDFSNLLGQRKLVRKIGISKNRRWHEIMLGLRGIVL